VLLGSSDNLYNPPARFFDLQGFRGNVRVTIGQPVNAAPKDSIGFETLA
jgi:hypothetical protein